MANKDDLAPDGAPKSHITMSQKRFALMEVTFKDTENYGEGSCMIRVSDFDKTKHKKVTRRKTLKSAEAPKPALSAFPKEELLTMTREALAGLPEYALIEEPSEEKEALVDQILAVREEASA